MYVIITLLSVFVHSIGQPGQAHSIRFHQFQNIMFENFPGLRGRYLTYRVLRSRVRCVFAVAGRPGASILFFHQVYVWKRQATR